MGDYYLYILGEGDGCDYTIGCNSTLIKLESDSYEDAEIEAAEEFIESGGHYGNIPYRQMIIFKEASILPIELWRDSLEEQQRFLEEGRIRKAELAELERLKKKYEK
jgi:hypothetical protein